MSFDLTGRKVLITGAGDGIGRALSLAFAAAGARVAGCARSESRMQALAEEIQGSDHVLRTADLTRLKDLETFQKEVLEQFGGLDVLVNNARRPRRDPGIPENADHQTFWESDPEIYRQTVEVNVTGTFLMARTGARYFVEKGSGKIINLTTSIRNFYDERQSPYGVTKAAIDSSTYIWSQDLKGTGVTVNAMLPGGACDTDPNQPPMPGRKLLPVDVMNPVLVWLCSVRSDGATGWRYNGSLWEGSTDPDAAAAGCREEPSIRGVGKPLQVS